MLSLQFRDLFYSVGDEFFGYVVEIKATKGDIGVVLLADYFASFQVNQQGVQPTGDNHTVYFLEIFYDYILKKMKLFSKQLDSNRAKLITNK